MSSTPPSVIERRREALLIATRLQRRNVAARWDQLRGNRVVGWVESAKALADGLRGTVALRGAAAGSLTAIASSALWAVRERSGWGLLAMAAKWWLRRRDRRRLREQAVSERRSGRRSFFSRARRVI